jgi:hypothetical protein
MLHLIAESGANLRLCTKTFTDCSGTSRTVTNLNSGFYYNTSASYRPCGFFLADDCSITNQGRWHCIDGDLSSPGQYTQYSFSATGYAGVGLTALQASRLNWVVCNYAYDASGVSAAVWYITGTGGSANTIYNAAVAAVPVADGSAAQMIFYKSNVAGVQDMIKWECKSTCSDVITCEWEVNGQWTDNCNISVCPGSTIKIGLNNYTSGSTITWSGPNSFNSTGDWIVVTTNASAVHVGTYTATITKGSCTYTKQLNLALANNCATTITNWSFDCEDGKLVDEYGYNANCNTTTTATIPNTANIYQYVVELVYKGTNPGSSVQVTNAAGTVYTLNRSTPFGTSSNVWVYRGLITGSTSSITYTNTNAKCDLQSLVVYAFRNDVNASASSGIFTNMSGYNDIQTITLTIPADQGPRDLVIEVPISELTADGRYLLLKATAGSVTNQVFLYGPNSALPGATCCLAIPTITLANVPGSVTQVVITVDTRHSQNGQSVNGQSWVIASGVNVDVECFDCDLTANAGADKSICSGLSTSLSGSKTGGTAPFTYSWNQGLGTGQNKTVSPTTTTTYTLTVTDANGCTATDQVVVTVNSLPTTNAGDDATICIGDNIVLTATGAGSGGSYSWNTVPVQTTASITVSPTTTATYTVTATNSNGCVKSDSKVVTVKECEGQICFAGVNNQYVNATSGWLVSYNIDPATNKVKIRTTLSKNFVDNTYGSNAIGWSGGHTFSQLTGSDHLIIALYDALGVKKMELKMDYLTASGAAPSGYKSLGVTGGDGAMIVGSASDVLSVVTSLDANFNQYGYVLTTNSPATDNSYTPNATYPNWIYDVWYETEVKLSAFGAAGFGTVGISDVHASPSKTGSNSEDVEEVDCCDIFAPTVSGSSALCSDNIAPTTLTASGGVSYLWSTGATTASIDVTPTVPTTYNVTVTSADGCVKTISKFVNVISCSGQLCFNGENGVNATANWTITYTTDPVNDKVKIKATLSKNFVDNTYGTNAIGWPGGHTFNQLVGSDHLILSLLDGNNVKKMETKLDYITASAEAPSGYKSLGVLGGDGSMIIGSSSDVLSVVTSLDKNFNQYGYVLTTNSPSTNADYAPNATYPNWIYEVWYEMEVRLSAFGSAGFGKVGITGVHASPSKTGNNTELVTEGPCCELETDITGDSIICAGESTVLTATYQLTNTSYINASEDNELYSKETGKNYGSCKDLYVGVAVANELSRALLKFNMSSLPANAVITDAYVELTKTGGSNTAANFAVHRVTKAWTEGISSCSGSTGASSWSQRQSGTAWTTAGGDYNATPESTISVGNNAKYAWNVKDLVLGWQNGTIPNNGILLKMVSESTINEKKFASSEEGDATERPVLVITYLVDPIAGQAEYLWSNGATTPSITVSPTVNTTYTVSVQESGECTGFETIEVVVNPKPTASAGADKIVCKGETTTLTASGGVSYLWSTGATTASINVTPLVTTTYIVTVTDANGCTDDDEVIVTVNNPVIGSVNNATICRGESATLTASGGTSYLWSTGASTASITVSPISTTTYSVVVTNSLGCSSTLNSTVTVNPLPTYTFGTKECEVFVAVYNVTFSTDASQVSVSAGTLVNNGGGNYSINDVPNNTNVTITLRNTVTGCERQVEVTAPNCLCPPLSPPVSGGDKEICIGQTIPALTVTTAPLSSVRWFDAAIGGNQLANSTTSYTPTQAGIYYAEAYLALFAGCKSERTPVELIINPKPIANAGDDQIICNGESATLTATGGATYLWSTGATTASITVAPTTTTTYSVVVTSDKGCFASDNVIVTVNSNPIATASADQSSCGIEIKTISASATGGLAPYTFVWDNGLGNGAIKSVSPSVTTIYTVKVIDANGCEDTDQVIITVNPQPTVDAGCGRNYYAKALATTLTAVASNGTGPFTYFILGIMV